MDTTQLLLLIGAFQGLFLGVVLIWKKQKQRENIFLAILLALMAFQTYLLSMDKMYDLFGCGLVNIFSRLVFLFYAPLIYFYIRTLVDSSFHWKNKFLWHFLPFVFFSILSAISYLTWEGESSSGWVHYIANTHYLFPVLHESLRLFYLLAYILFAIKWLRRYQEESHQLFSNEKQIQVGWLYQFLGASFLLWCIVALGLRVNFYDGNPHSNAFQSLFFVLPCFIFWVSFKAMTHPSAFRKIDLSPKKAKGQKVEETPNGESGKYHRSGLKPSTASEIKNQLLHLMENKKPYLESNLKLKDLAAFLDIKPHHLSQVLNEQLNCNFYEFVNTHRIAAAKNKLRDVDLQHLTIEAIAFESGFNSKSTFNTLFKKQVGQTPGQWKKGTPPGQWEPA